MVANHDGQEVLSSHSLQNRGRDRMVVGIQLPITTDVVSSNLEQGEVYNIM